MWSDVSTWPNRILPVNGDNVTIKAEYRVLLDINPPKMNNLIIKSTLIIPGVLKFNIYLSQYDVGYGYFKGWQYHHII